MWKAPHLTKKAIAAIGIENLVVIDTPDALLVADRTKSQNVKLVVEALSKVKIPNLQSSLPQYKGLENLYYAHKGKRLPS